MGAELAMGPILFHWEAKAKRDFWFRIADEADVGTAYLGETVCAKRESFFSDFADEVAQRLRRAGKTVVWSSLAQVVNSVDRRASLGIAGIEDSEIEANDASVLPHLKGKQHRIGPYLNVYNERSVAHLAHNGARHFCLQPELPAEAIGVLAAAARNAGAGVEVQVFGRVSLALSARCYHARAHGRTKDSCQFVCENSPDGMELETRSREKFLAVNGIQTLSHRYLDLAREIPTLIRMGVTALRLSPHSADMVQVAHVYRRLIDGEMGPEEAASRLSELGIRQPTMNGFFHRKPGYMRVAAH